MQSILAGLPYNSISKIMVRGLGTKVKGVLNKFPVRTGGALSTISSEQIVEGKRKMDFNQKRFFLENMLKYMTGQITQQNI